MFGTKVVTKRHIPTLPAEPFFRLLHFGLLHSRTQKTSLARANKLDWSKQSRGSDFKGLTRFPQSPFLLLDQAGKRRHSSQGGTFIPCPMLWTT